MRLFGYEIKKIEPPKPPLSRIDAMCNLADELTHLWNKHREEGGKCRPWVQWDDKEVIIVKYNNLRHERVSP